MGRHSNSSARYNKAKFDTTAVERGSVIQGPSTLPTTSKPLRNRALLVFPASCVSQESPSSPPTPPSHPWSHAYIALTTPNQISPLIKRNHPVCSASASCCRLQLPFVTQLLFTINRFISPNSLINNKTLLITPSSESRWFMCRVSASWCIHSSSKQSNIYTNAICYWKRNESTINPRRDSVAAFQIHSRDENTLARPVFRCLPFVSSNWDITLVCSCATSLSPPPPPPPPGLQLLLLMVSVSLKRLQKMVSDCAAPRVFQPTPCSLIRPCSRTWRCRAPTPAPCVSRTPSTRSWWPSTRCSTRCLTSRLKVRDQATPTAASSF